MTRNAWILIVDDDQDIRDVFRFVLEGAGYFVNVAANGLDAWGQITPHMRPALIILDLMMPVMDGEQFLKKLRSSPYAEVPVVIMSGNNTAKKKATELNANCCLVKPIEFDELLNMVKRFVPIPSKRDVA